MQMDRNNRGIDIDGGNNRGIDIDGGKQQRYRYRRKETIEVQIQLEENSRGIDIDGRKAPIFL